MTFELWSIQHILYMLSPALIFASIYYGVRKASDKTKYIVGAVLGALSVLILIVRNVDIFARVGWDLEVIPLQVCHIGSVIAGLALITKRKWMIATAFCFNIMPAFLAMVFADSLTNYDTLWKIRPQTYVWGHILIIVCALYGMFVFLPKLEKKDLIHSITFVGSASIVAIICNSAFRATLGWEPNYFYLYDYSGTPLKFLYNALPTSTYGWFSINWFYTLTLFAVFVALFIGLFILARVLVKYITERSEKVTESVCDSALADEKSEEESEVTV